MALTLTLSIIAVLGCLWSRIRLPRRIIELIRLDNKLDPYTPELILFFGFIRKLGPNRLRQTLGKLPPEKEIEVLSHQLHAFVLFGLSLIAFLLPGHSISSNLTKKIQTQSQSDGYL